MSETLSAVFVSQIKLPTVAVTEEGSPRFVVSERRSRGSCNQRGVTDSGDLTLVPQRPYSNISQLAMLTKTYNFTAEWVTKN